MSQAKTDIIPESGLGPQNGRWRQWVERSITGLQSGRGSSKNDTANSFKATNSSLQLLTKQIEALPIPRGFYVSTSNFGLSAGVKTLQQSISVPTGKTKVVLTAIGNVQVLDRTSGGVTVAYANLTAPSFSWSSPQVYASKDAGASAVNNIITPALGFQQTGLTPGSSFTLYMNIDALNRSAFPVESSNFATITISAIFFD